MAHHLYETASIALNMLKHGFEEQLATVEAWKPQNELDAAVKEEHILYLKQIYDRASCVLDNDPGLTG